VKAYLKADLLENRQVVLKADWKVEHLVVQLGKTRAVTRVARSDAVKVEMLDRLKADWKVYQLVAEMGDLKAGSWVVA
jgi:hypothetical protein